MPHELQGNLSQAAGSSQSGSGVQDGGLASCNREHLMAPGRITRGATIIGTIMSNVQIRQPAYMPMMSPAAAAWSQSAGFHMQSQQGQHQLQCEREYAQVGRGHMSSDSFSKQS
jgi:hypothetical protein